jgi:hypothetical protein
MGDVARRSKAVRVPVALGGEIAHEPGLPLPFVRYPKHYGVFCTFADSEDGPFIYCDCALPALAVIAELTGTLPQGGHAQFVPELTGAPPEQAAVADSHSAHAICHRCRMQTPTMRWAHEMYEGRFNQFHGWYTRQAQLRHGLLPNKPRGPFSATMSPEVRELAERVVGELDLPARERRAAKKLAHLFENEARAEFGFRPIGEGWVSEALLFAIVTRLLPSEPIVRHARPPWLQGLELDIFVPRLCVGVEYQGQQHFIPVKAWGGSDALARTRERDGRKRKLCTSQGIQLVTIDYTEPLTAAHVLLRLQSAVPSLPHA